MLVHQALRSVVLAVLFITAASLFALRNLFRRVEALELEQNRRHRPTWPRPIP